LILVTVGTPTYDFSRLVKAVDDLVKTRRMNEKVLVQIGYTKYIPQNCKWFRFDSPENMEKLCKRCRIYISHGGIGSLIMPLEHGKPVISVPRLKEFGEHVDNHQLQIAKEMEKQGKIIAVYDISKLGDAIDRAGRMKIKYKKRESKIIGIVEKFLEGLER